MPVGVEYNGIEEKDIGKARVVQDVFLPEHTPCGKVADFVAGEERTCRAQTVLELRETIVDVRQLHRLRHLCRIVFGERLETTGLGPLEKSVGRMRPSLVEEHFSVDTPPALAEVSVR